MPFDVLAQGAAHAISILDGDLHDSYAMINLSELYEQSVTVLFRLYNAHGVQMNTCAEFYVKGDIDQPVNATAELWADQ